MATTHHHRKADGTGPFITDKATVTDPEITKTNVRLSAVEAAIVALEARVSLLEHPVVVPPPAPLSITSVTVTSITDTSALIGWTLSDFATGQVQYGTTTTYGKTTTREPSFTYKAHAQTISGLVAGTLYHFKCLSQNQSGTTAVSADGTFTTTGGATIPPAPTGLTAVPGDKKVTTGWS